MASGMKKISAFLSLVSLVAVVSSAGEKCPGTANYTLSFYGLWKQDRHPNTALPSSAHFSPLVGCSHGSDYVMWRAGAKASSGVEIVAETGGTSTLVSEINTQIAAKKAWKLILPGGPQLGAEAMKTGIDVEVTANFSKVSIITMLAPSPDWFIGIDSLDLCDSGKWRESMNVTMLPPWDAGTEDGTAFSISNAATNPPVNIFQITNSMSGAFNGPNPIPSLGEFRFMGLHLPEVSQDNSTINSTSAPPATEKSTAMSTMATTTDSSVGKASASFAVFISAALILAQLLF